MLRIIARIDVKAENAIQGIQLDGLRKLGRANEFAKRYYEEGADELLFIDPVASLFGTSGLPSLVQETTDIYVPITAGGGIRSTSDAETILRSGADKVLVNTAALLNPGLIRELANEFGSQAVVVSVESKQIDGHHLAYAYSGRDASGYSTRDWILRLGDLGAGEVFLTSVDCDGLMGGFDESLLDNVFDATNLPLVLSGGFADPKQIFDISTRYQISGVAIGAAFHYKKMDIATLRKYLVDMGVEVRSA